MFTATYYIAVLAVTLGASTQFYSYGVVNQQQQLLVQWVNETYRLRGRQLAETELNVFWSFVVSSVAIGGIPGALLTRHFAEVLGRRNALIVNAAINVMAALVEFGAKFVRSPEFLIVGRFFLGVNMGLTSGLVPMYLMEITPAQHRGKAGTLHQVAVAFSEWCSLLLGLPELLGTEKRWPFAFGVPGVLALFLCIVLPFCPESPKFLLIQRGRKAAAKSALLRLVDKPTADFMFQSLIRESTTTKQTEASFRELFTSKDFRLPLLISISMMLAQQFSGCSAVFAYSTEMLLNAQLSPRWAQMSTLGVGFVYFLFACSAPLLIDRVGKRRMTLFQLSFVTISLSCLSIFSWVQNNVENNYAAYGTIGSVVVYMGAYGMGSPIPWIITNDLFDTRLRPTAVTVAVFLAWFLSFVISTAYLPFKSFVGVSFSYLPFILLSAIFTVILGRLLPSADEEEDADDPAQVIRQRRRDRSDSWISDISVI